MKRGREPSYATVLGIAWLVAVTWWLLYRWPTPLPYCGSLDDPQRCTGNHIEQ